MTLKEFVTLLRPAKKSEFCDRPYWTANIGEARATGEDALAALAALRKLIKRAFAGSYTPVILPYRGHLGLVTRSSSGWQYSITSPDAIQQYEARACNRICLVGFYDTEEECLASLRRHLAQYAWDGVEESSPLLLDEEDQRKFTDDCRYQKRYAALRKLGLDDYSIREQIRREGL